MHFLGMDDLLMKTVRFDAMKRMTKRIGCWKTKPSAFAGQIPPLRKGGSEQSDLFVGKW